MLEGGGGGKIFRGERFHGYIENASEGAETNDGDVAAAELYFSEETNGEFSLFGELLLGEAAASAGLA